MYIYSEGRAGVHCIYLLSVTTVCALYMILIRQNESREHWYYVPYIPPIYPLHTFIISHIYPIFFSSFNDEWCSRIKNHFQVNN